MSKHKTPPHSPLTSPQTGTLQHACEARLAECRLENPGCEDSFAERAQPAALQLQLEHSDLLRCSGTVQREWQGEVTRTQPPEDLTG